MATQAQLDLMRKITDTLLERGYGRISAEALGRAWSQLATDRSWSTALALSIVEDASDRGMLPDEMRSALAIVDDAAAVHGLPRRRAIKAAKSTPADPAG